MDNKLVEKLKWIESEVLALKQAHEYGLGMAECYYKYQSYESSSTLLSITLRCTIQYGPQATDQPFQILRYSKTDLLGATWDNRTKQYRFVFTASHFVSEPNHPVWIVSTKPIISVTIEEIE